MRLHRCFAFFLVVMLFLTGCERAPSKSKVIGTYSGTLNGASETLVLRADDTFSQDLTLPAGKKVVATGKWRLTYKAVEFDNYMYFYDPAKNGALVEPSPVYGMTYIWGADMLIRDWDSGYYTLKHR